MTVGTRRWRRGPTLDEWRAEQKSFDLINSPLAPSHSLHTDLPSPSAGYSIYSRTTYCSSSVRNSACQTCDRGGLGTFSSRRLNPDVLGRSSYSSEYRRLTLKVIFFDEAHPNLQKRALVFLKSPRLASRTSWCFFVSYKKSENMIDKNMNFF